MKSGLVAEHDFGEGFKRYEHLFGQPPVREHLVCTECGKVTAIHSARLLELHPYETPELLVLDADGSRDYLRWLEESTSPRR